MVKKYVRGSRTGNVLPHTKYGVNTPHGYSPNYTKSGTPQRTIKVARSQDNMQEVPVTSLPKAANKSYDRNNGRKGSDSINTGYTGYPTKTYTNDQRGVHRREKNPPVISDLAQNSDNMIRRMNPMTQSARTVGDQVTDYETKISRLRRSANKKLKKARRKRR